MSYFDAGATTFQKPPQVARAVQQAMRCCSSPGRGGYRQAMQADALVFSCRQTAASLFGAQPEQVVFTMNATHGLNIALSSLVSPGGRVVVSGYEHNAVMRPLHLLGARVQIASAPLFQPDAMLEAMEQALKTPTDACVCTHVSNVFGYRLPVEEIAALCHARGIPFVLDASQSAGCLPIDLTTLNAAFIAMPGHKGLYGPQGTGILLCGMPGKPLMAGGTGSQSALYDMPQELPDRHEAGTHNVAGLAGLQAGMEFVRRRGLGTILYHETQLKDQAVRMLTVLPHMRVFSVSGPEQTGVLSVVTRQDCEIVAQELARRGIAVRAGLHCAPLAHQTAGTLESGTVRISFSAFNTFDEVRGLCRAMAQILAQEPACGSGAHD